MNLYRQFYLILFTNQIRFPFFIEVGIFQLYSSSFTEISWKIYLLQRHLIVVDSTGYFIISFCNEIQLNDISQPVLKYAPLYYERLRYSCHEIYAERIHILLGDHPFKTSACLRGGGVSPCAYGSKVQSRTSKTFKIDMCRICIQCAYILF